MAFKSFSRLAFIVAALALSFVSPCLGSEVDSLRIDVALRQDGSALVTETWNIDVSSDISEWYLVAYNLGGMDIRNLKVIDETGTRFVTEEGTWNVDRSRKEKAGRCGLIPKNGGYEICWGVGSSGSHRYTVAYDLVGLVKSYSDADGFNHMFVAKDLGSSPRNVELRIHSDGLRISEDNSGIWGFGFAGDINFEDGDIVARSSEPFRSRSSMIVMARFDKGLFQPVLSESRSFEEVKEKAFEGSDYGDEGGMDWIEIAFIIFFAIVSGIGIVAMIAYGISVHKRKKELYGGSRKDVPWFRSTPVDGNLFKANGVLKVMDGTGGMDKLIAAYMTRLFYKKALSVVPDGSGKPGKTCIKVNDFNPEAIAPEAGLNRDGKLELELYSFLKEAAGADMIINPKEISRWANKHGKKLSSWQDRAKSTETIYSLTKDDVRGVYGLKRFLKDFTLIGDRGVTQVGLWNDYLIFATLFGIADQVRKDFKKICPEYFTLSDTAASLETASTWVVINRMSNDFNNSAVNYKLNGSGTRSGGGGGRVSFGGGGGFSGGGHGGGGR